MRIIPLRNVFLPLLGIATLTSSINAQDKNISVKQAAALEMGSRYNKY